VENYRRAIASCQAQGNVLGVIIGHFNIGDFMIQDEQYEPAIHELRLAFDLAHQQRILDVELDAGFYLVDAYTSLARYDEAELELERLRPTIGKDSTPRSLGLEQVATARLASKRADQEKALECFERGMEFLDAVQFKDDQCARAHLAYALFLNDNGRKPDARRVLQKGKLLFIELNNNLGLRSVERLEAQLA
jgi:tetratricopeptide (TPR) repeat protein